jgi:hypothetical protein
MYTDPTGHGPCVKDASRNIDYVESIMNLPEIDWLDTYTAAGIAVQCYGMEGDFKPGNDTWGPAQVSYSQASYTYGERIPNPSDPNNVNEQRGFGLRCYVPYGVIDELGYCSICLTEDAMKKQYGKDYRKYFRLEHLHDPENVAWAVKYMRRRIKLVTDFCTDKGCTETDKYIAAALSQNGPGFTTLNINGKDVKWHHIDETWTRLDWNEYFNRPSNSDDTQKPLKNFIVAIHELEARGWSVPHEKINWNTINELIAIGN